MLHGRRFLAALFVSIITLYVLPMGAPCQTRAERTRSKLKLLLHVGEFRDNLPARFVISLVNISDKEVSVPEVEYVNCRNSLRGTITLHVLIGNGENLSRGCPSEGPLEAIEWRALTWRVLQPGESLQIGTRDEHYNYSSWYKGNFEFWADYAPPVFSEEDRAWLKKRGMYVPDRELHSKHYEFEKK